MGFDASKYLNKAKGKSSTKERVEKPTADTSDLQASAQRKLDRLRKGGGDEPKKPASSVPRNKFKANKGDREAEEAAKAAKALEELYDYYYDLLDPYDEEFLMERGIFNDDMEIDGDDGLLEATKVLWEFEEITVCPPALPTHVKVDFATWRKAITVASPETRENHEPGEVIDDKTGDVITDLQKAAETPNNGLNPGLYEYVTKEWNFSRLSDFERCDEAQLLELNGVGAGTIRKLKKMLEANNIILGSKVEYETMTEEEAEALKKAAGKTPPPPPQPQPPPPEKKEKKKIQQTVPAVVAAPTMVEPQILPFRITYVRKINNPTDTYESVTLGVVDGPAGVSFSGAIKALKDLKREIDELAESTYE